MKINIIGNGRIAHALVKKIIEDQLIINIDQINIWSRKKINILDGSSLVYSEDRVYEDIMGMYLLSRDEINKYRSIINYHYYFHLDDLKAIAADTSEEDILIITVKYNLKELFYYDLSNLIEYNAENQIHMETLIYRYRNIYADTEEYDLLDYCAKKQKIIKEMEAFKRQYNKIEACIENLAKDSSVGYERMYNLKNSVIGIINLAKALRGYHGFVVNLVNEIEITNMFLAEYSGIKFEKIISPCENDNIRAKYFFLKGMEECGINENRIKIEFFGPHNHNGFIPKEKIYINDKPISTLYDDKMVDQMIERATLKVNEFGEKIYLKKGSSDEDTIEGIYLVLKNYILSNEESNITNSVVRISCFSKNEGIYYGRNVVFEKRKSMNMGKLEYSDEAMHRLELALKEQRRIYYTISEQIEK